MLPDSLATRETVFCASEFESQPNWLSVRLSTFFMFWAVIAPGPYHDQVNIGAKLCHAFGPGSPTDRPYFPGDHRSTSVVIHRPNPLKRRGAPAPMHE